MTMLSTLANRPGRELPGGATLHSFLVCFLLPVNQTFAHLEPEPGSHSPDSYNTAPAGAREEGFTLMTP